MKLTGKNYVAGKLSSKGNVTFKTFNPNLNSENNVIFYQANKEEIENAIDSAFNAFKVYQKISDENKAIFFDEIAYQIDNLGEQLISVYTEETGLPIGRAENEKNRTINQIKSFANLLREKNWKENYIDHADLTRKPLPKPEIFKTYYPIGPVVVFTPSNFPLAFSTAGSDTISALAAGCPVIVKSHSMHSGTGELISYAINNAIKKTKMPDGIFSNLNGKENEVGEFLKTCDEIKLWSWKKEYFDQEVMDGTQWELKIKKARKLRGRNISGSNSYPQPIDNFNKFIIAINKLAGSEIELVEDI